MGPEARVWQPPGEERLAIVRGGALLAARVRQLGDGPWPGSVWQGRLVGGARAARAALAAGAERIELERPPPGAAQGMWLAAEIVRAPLPERGRLKPARGRPVPPRSPVEGMVGQAPSLAGALGVRPVPGWPPEVEAAWAEALAEAELGEVALPGGGRLLAEPTAGGTVFDVDGDAPSAGVEAMRAVAARILLWGLGGSILVDLPRPAARPAWREAAARALDEAVAGWPAWAPRMQRTAVNGFGLVQIVLPRSVPSLLERARWRPARQSALALLAQAARGLGQARLHAGGQAFAWLAQHRALVDEAARQRGGRLELVEAPSSCTAMVEDAGAQRPGGGD